MSDSSATEIGWIEAIFRYPVKSMRGESLDAAALGWHGLEGDRRLAFRRADVRGGFPWLTASKLPELVCLAPHGRGEHASEALPTHVRTPDGDDLPVFGEALAQRVGARLGATVEMTHLRNGIFDDATISVITSATVREVCGLGGRSPDVRRFRPNVLVRSAHARPFEEDAWVGGVLTFGELDHGPSAAITARDVRCAMINIDPDDGSTAPEMLRAIVRAHENQAGVYGTVVRSGRLQVGQPVVLRR